MRTGPTNKHLKNLIASLKKQKINLWQRIARELSKPTRKRRTLNLSKIQRFAKEGETIIVPGKVLAAGNLTKRVTIAAWQFSEKAENMIKKSGSSIITIEDLMKKNPKGTDVRILG